MSDTESSIKTRKKVVMTQDRLDKLALARLSALAKKAQMKELTNKTKELKKVEFESKLDTVTKALEKTQIVEPIIETKVEQIKLETIKEKPKKKINKPKPKPITPPSSSSDETSSSSSEEEEIVYKKPKKKIQKQKTKYEMSDEVTKDILFKKIQDDNYKTLFQSMFPNYSIM
jgi:hypothetical protein